MAGRLEEGKKKKKKKKKKWRNEKKASIFTSTGGDSKDLGSKFRAIDPTNLSTRI